MSKEKKENKGYIPEDKDFSIPTLISRLDSLILFAAYLRMGVSSVQERC